MQNTEIPDFDLPTFFKYFSAEAWTRIALSHRTRGIRVSEVTLTQDLVYKFYMLSKHLKFPIKIFESQHEKANGNDLEILLETENGVLKIPCQAKIVNPSGRFRKINHVVGKKLQIDLLQQYASKIKGYPCYLFYNHFYRGNINKLEELLAPVMEHWGCSIGSARKIKKFCFVKKQFQSPHFYDLHPHICRPLHELVETLIPEFSEYKLKQLFSDLDINRVKLYSIEDVLNEVGWNDLTPKARLGYIPNKNKDLERLLKPAGVSDVLGFNPQFRVLITRENQNTVTIQYLD